MQKIFGGLILGVVLAEPLFSAGIAEVPPVVASAEIGGSKSFPPVSLAVPETPVVPEAYLTGVSVPHESRLDPVQLGTGDSRAGGALPDREASRTESPLRSSNPSSASSSNGPGFQELPISEPAGRLFDGTGGAEDEGAVPALPAGLGRPGSNVLDAIKLAAYGTRKQKKKLRKALGKKESNELLFIEMVQALVNPDDRVSSYAGKMLAIRQSVPERALLALVSLSGRSDQIDKTIVEILRAQRGIPESVWEKIGSRLNAAPENARLWGMLPSLVKDTSPTPAIGAALVDLALSPDAIASQEALKALKQYSLNPSASIPEQSQLKLLLAWSPRGPERHRWVDTSEILGKLKNIDGSVWSVIENGLSADETADAYLGLLVRRWKNPATFPDSVLTVLAGMIGGRDEWHSALALGLLRDIAPSRALPDLAQRNLLDLGFARPDLWPGIAALIAKQAALGDGAWSDISAALADGGRLDHAATLLAERSTNRSDFPDSVLMQLAKILMRGKNEIAVNGAAAALQAVRQPLPERAQALLFAARIDPSAHAWLKAAEILGKQRKLAPKIWEEAAADLEAGGSRAAAVADFIGSAPTIEIPEPFVDVWTAYLRKIPDSESRRTMARSLEPRLPLARLLEIVQPDRAAETLDLLPSLRTMNGKGFFDSALSDSASLDELLSCLRLERTELGREAYETKVANFTSLDKIQTSVLRASRRSKYATGAGLDYELPYAVPNVDVGIVEDQAAYLIYQPGIAADAAMKRSFEHFDSLIQANFRALGLLARGDSGLTRQSADFLMDELKIMVDELGQLGNADPAIGEAYRRLRDALGSQWNTLPPSALLPPELARRVLEHEGRVAEAKAIRNVHTLINYVHQKSLEALMGRARGLGRSGHFSYGGYWRLNLLNLGGPLVHDRRVVNPLLRLILKAKTPNRANVIFKDDEAWLHLQLGCHIAEIYIRDADPDAGGGVELRYSDSGDSSAGSKARLEYIRRALVGLGIPAVVEGKYLRASFNKDTGLTSRAGLQRTFPAILTLLTKTYNFDLRFGSYPEDVREALLAEMPSAFLAEGLIPVPDGDIKGSMKVWRENAPLREKLRVRLDAELARLGLPSIPSGDPMGQATIDAYFTRPIRAGLAAGTLTLDDQGLPQIKGSALQDFAAFVAGQRDAALTLADVLRAVDPTELEFAPIGSVGRFRAELAQRETSAGAVLSIVALRDAETGAFAFAGAHVWDGASRTRLDGDGVGRLLALDGAVGTEPEAAGRHQRSSWIRQLWAEPETIAADVSPGQTVSAGGGWAVGAVAFDKSRVARGDVFLAPFTSPDDLEAMRRAAAVVTTGGGMLSHAAITARELGVPALILSGARWRQVSGRDVLEMPVVDAREPRRDPNGLWVRDAGRERFVAVHAGDFVIVDSGRGTVEPVEKTVGRRMLSLRRRLDALDGSVASLRTITGLVASAPPVARRRIVRALVDYSLSERRFLGNPNSPRAFLLSVVDGLDVPSRADLKREIVSRLASERTSIELELEEPSGDPRRAMGRIECLRTLAEAFGVDPGMLLRSEKMASDLFARADLAAADNAARASAASLRRESRAASLNSEGRLARARPTTLPLGAIDEDDTALTGGKAAKLGEILRVVQGLAYVPEGVAVTTEAYGRFLREAGIERDVMREAAELDRYLARADLNSALTLDAVRRRSEKIRTLIRSASLSGPSPLGRELLAALAAHGMAAGPFAVRSSAVQEDGADAAFAGAADTFLYVQPDEVLDKIVDGWASFWLERGILYRRQRGVSSVEMSPALIVQRMVDSDAAGVLFTVNPASGRNETIINAAYGQGEGVVSGLVQADQYAADSQGEELRVPMVGDKRVKIAKKSSGRGTEIRPVPAKLRKLRALSREQVRQLARIGSALTRHFGYPVDVEFAVERGNIAVLQVRPVTTATAEPR